MGKPIKIEYKSGGHDIKVVLEGGDAFEKAMREAAKDPGISKLPQGEELVSKLRGYARRTGFTMSHYKDGQLDDMADGSPAKRKFNERDVVVIAERYNKGARNDSPSGEAAYRTFDDRGAVIEARHYKEGQHVNMAAKPAPKRPSGPGMR